MRLEALQPSRLRHGLGNDGRFLEETCRFSMGFSISSVCLRSDASSTNVFFSLIIIFTRDNVWAWDDLPHKSFQCGHSCYSSHRFSIHDLPYQSWFVFMLVLPIILLLVARLGIDCWTHPSGSRMTTIKTLLESWRKNMK